MQAQLENLARTLPLEELPKFVGDLRTAEMVAVLRVSTPTPTATQGGDVLVDVAEAAQRLGQSTEWIYKHQKSLPFVRHLGRSIRCSVQGIDLFIRRTR